MLLGSEGGEASVTIDGKQALNAIKVSTALLAKQTIHRQVAIGIVDENQVGILLGETDLLHDFGRLALAKNRKHPTSSFYKNTCCRPMTILQ